MHHAAVVVVGGVDIHTLADQGLDGVHLTHVDGVRELVLQVVKLVLHCLCHHLPQLRKQLIILAAVRGPPGQSLPLGVQAKSGQNVGHDHILLLRVVGHHLVVLCPCQHQDGGVACRPAGNLVRLVSVEEECNLANDGRHVHLLPVHRAQHRLPVDVVLVDDVKDTSGNEPQLTADVPVGDELLSRHEIHLVDIHQESVHELLVASPQGCARDNACVNHGLELTAGNAELKGAWQVDVCAVGIL
mmetsp:Transcript_39825/g.112987  ORF Transcript_39825/g.112987 Transcript_39825/m.112987 type:complete len:244 (-) Transcript_39825:314-1045(-)